MTPNSPLQTGQMSTGFPLLFLSQGTQVINNENVSRQTQRQSLVGYFLISTPTYDPGEAIVQTNISFLRSKLATLPEHIRSLIRIDPGVMHGNPVLQGTRIPIYQVIEELADGTRLEELPECFPSLNETNIQAGLDFAIRLLRIYDD